MLYIGNKVIYIKAVFVKFDFDVHFLATDTSLQWSFEKLEFL